MAREQQTKPEKFYPKSRTLQSWHHLLTLTDPRIHDYLVAAPILILPLTKGAQYRYPKHRQFVCRRAGEIAHRGEKLKALLKKYDIPNPLRKISRECITTRYNSLFVLLAGVPPSILSQAIPKTAKAQKHYFKNLFSFLDRIATRGRTIDQHETLWGVRNMTDSHYEHADDLGDYFVYTRMRQAGTGELKFSFQTALKRMAEWHEIKISQSQLADCEAHFGVRHDWPVPYAPMPERMAVDGFEFVALQTYKDLLLDGQKMHHCVGSYFSDVLHRGSRIYSIQKDGNNLATIEYSNGPRFSRPSTKKPVLSPDQCKGKYNAKPSAEILNAVKEFSAICRGNKWFDLEQPQGVT